MKCQIIYKHKKHLVIPLPGKLVRVTHWSEPTKILSVSDLFNELQEENELTFIANDGSEVIITKDERHGFEGFRGNRYVEDNWDGHYLFYRFLDDLVDDMQKCNFKKARNDF